MTAIGTVLVELRYSDCSTRLCRLSIVPDVLVSSAGHWYAGVTYPGQTDIDLETVVYGVQEGRATHCEYKPLWAGFVDSDEIEFIAWRIVDGIDLLVEHGIVDPPTYREKES